MPEIRERIVAELNGKLGPCVSLVEDNTNESILVEPNKMLEVATELRDNSSFRFDMVINMATVDYPENYTLVYHLLSTTYASRIALTVQLPKDNPEVPSIAEVFKSANVQEREAFDLMGINFVGHPNLKRILLPDDFVGHPLRKDFKMEAGA